MSGCSLIFLTARPSSTRIWTLERKMARITLDEEIHAFATILKRLHVRLLQCSVIMPTIAGFPLRTVGEVASTPLSPQPYLWVASGGGDAHVNASNSHCRCV